VSVDTAQQALNSTTLVAPGDGTVTAVNGTVGQRAGSSSGSSTGGAAASSGSSTNLVVQLDLDRPDRDHEPERLQVRANLAEIDVAKVKAGQDATVTLNRAPGHPAAREGRLRRPHRDERHQQRGDLRRHPDADPAARAAAARPVGERVHHGRSCR